MRREASPAGHTFFSSVCEALSETDSELGRNGSLSRFERTEVIVSGKSGIKLEIRKKNEGDGNKTWPINTCFTGSSLPQMHLLEKKNRLKSNDLSIHIEALEK